MNNPWNLPDMSKLRHRQFKWEALYCFDECYEEWLLWVSNRYVNLSEFSPDEFEVLSK